MTTLEPRVRDTPRTTSSVRGDGRVGELAVNVGVGPVGGVR